MKRGKGIYLWSAVLLMSVMAGCAVTDFDRTADFSRYKTFEWGETKLDAENPLYKSDLINDNIRRTVKTEFAKRGITHSTDKPDFIVSYHTYTEKKEQATPGAFYPGAFYPFGFYPVWGFRYMYGWGFPYYGYGMPPRVESYTEGTLIIDVTDRTSGELIWRGTVSGNIDNTANLQKQIEKGVRAIMKKYPVDAVKGRSTVIS